MKSGWFILLYHEISWEQDAYLRGLGGTCPPDLFSEHVQAVARLGELLPVPEALNRWQAGRLTGPTFSFWFDDGMVGVRRYAAPILREHGVTGAASICSRFTDRQELFWRAKLAYLNANGGVNELRSRLAYLGYRNGQSLRDFTLDRFTLPLVREIDAAYDAFTTPEQRADAFRLFDTAAGLRELQAAGWTITNHTASHLPVSEDSAIEWLEEQFVECERYLERESLGETRFWVVPFDRPGKRAERLWDRFRGCCGDRYLVLVGDQRNPPYDNHGTRLFRMTVPVVPAKQAIRRLRRMSRLSTA